VAIGFPIGMSSLMVGGFSISEGLASVFALVLRGQDVSAEGTAASISNLGTPESALTREPELRADLLAQCDRIATREMIVRLIESGSA